MLSRAAIDVRVRSSLQTLLVVKLLVGDIHRLRCDDAISDIGQLASRYGREMRRPGLPLPSLHCSNSDHWPRFPSYLPNPSAVSDKTGSRAGSTATERPGDHDSLLDTTKQPYPFPTPQESPLMFPPISLNFARVAERSPRLCKTLASNPA